MTSGWKQGWQDLRNSYVTVRWNNLESEPSLSVIVRIQRTFVNGEGGQRNPSQTISPCLVWNTAVDVWGWTRTGGGVLFMTLCCKTVVCGSKLWPSYLPASRRLTMKVILLWLSVPKWLSYHELRKGTSFTLNPALGTTAVGHQT